MKSFAIAIESSKGRIAAAVHPGNSTSLAILCPGYLDTKDYTHLVELANDLQKHGVTAVRFDPTGTWGSDGAIADYTNTQYLSDIESVLGYMKQSAEYKKILVGGHSRGGQMSLLYTSTHTDATHALGIMPSTGKRLSNEKRNEWKLKGVSISNRDVPHSVYETRTFKVPYSHVIDRDRYDILRTAQDITIPVALIAGEHDMLIPPEEVCELYDVLRCKKYFEVIKNIGHDHRKNSEEVRTVNIRIIHALIVIGFLE